MRYHNHLARRIKRSQSQPNTFGAKRGKAKDRMANPTIAPTRQESGSALSETGAIWLLRSSQRRPMRGTANKSDANAAAKRPPNVRSESIL
jgi:hypothetical protein